MLAFRYATRADFETFYERTPPFSLRAMVAERDGEIVAFGGYYMENGIAVAFTDSSGLTKREAVLGGRKMMDMLRGLKVPIVATTQEGGTALRHYGFRPFGDVYRYEP